MRIKKVYTKVRTKIRTKKTFFVIFHFSHMRKVKYRK
jgi:hypothetical protein